MNNPLPAALASIKRYAIPEFGNALYEDKDGFLFYVDDVFAAFATLPPPGAVTDEMVERACVAAALEADHDFPWSEYGETMKSECRQLMHHALVSAFAAPPADSAMVDAKHYEQALKDAFEEGGISVKNTVDWIRARARTLLAGRGK